MSLSDALSTLANYRSHNTRASQDIFQKGSVVLKANATSKMGDDGWAFLEQLALAAIDIGRIDVADECLEHLQTHFPESPRVEVLAGIRLEATETPETALEYYDSLLEIDSANGAAWKRRISVLRRMGKLEIAVSQLAQYLDTFYNDVEGWLELADIYAECNQYNASLQALSHLLLLNPQNPFYILKYAETAYTTGDIPLALKTFLVVIDMSERDEDISSGPPIGISVRAWYGVKLCTRYLLTNPSTSSPSHTPVTKNLKAVDELATERVLSAYIGKEVEGKSAIRDWVGGTATI